TAPERIAGTAWDRRADVFSLAALLHDMLWGRRVAGIGSQAADALTEVPDGNLALLRVAFARALASEPVDRFSNALDFAAAVKEAVQGVADRRASWLAPSVPVAAEPVPPVPPSIEPPPIAAR